MAALSMQDIHDRSAFVKALSGSHRYILEYLIEEVLDRQPEKIQAFLQQTSILDKLCAPLCEALLEAQGDSQSILNHLNRSNIFIIPLDETTFTFDVGENPQPGQTWELNKEFDIAGYKMEVVSARAVTYSDIEVNPETWDPQTNAPDRPPEGSQGFDYGYQFTFKIDPSLGMSNVAMDILSDSCGMSDVRPMGASPLKFYTQLCRDGYPKGIVKVILRSISVIVENLGKVVWSPK